MVRACRPVFDPARARRRLDGCRGVGTLDRSLMFRAEGLVIDVLVQRGGADLGVLQGQVLWEMSGRPAGQARVHLPQHGAIANADDAGQFTLSAQAPHCEGTLLVQAVGTTVRCHLAAPGRC